MSIVIITAEVEDAAKWEAGFRTHGDLFRSQTVTRIDFGIGEDNNVAVSFEADDLEIYMKGLDSPATVEAMEFDGVKRETVKIFVLDQIFDP